MWGGGGGGGIKCNGSVWPRTEFTFGIELCMVSIYIKLTSTQLNVSTLLQHITLN